MIDSLKAVLGEEAFGEHFIESFDASQTRFVSALEVLHYTVVFLDDHLYKKGAYKEKPEGHIYKLLATFTVPSPPLCDGGFFL